MLTIKSKLCADKVLKIRSKLQSGLGAVHWPAKLQVSPAPVHGLVAEQAAPEIVQVPVAPRVHVLPAAQVVLFEEQTAPVGAAVHAVSWEKSCELICWKRSS